jgi:transposase
LYQAGGSPIGAKALEYFGLLYEVERTVVDADSEVRRRARDRHSRPIMHALREWMMLQRSQVPEGSATAKSGLATPKDDMDSFTLGLK